MVAALGFITSCASVNTNVSDYYLKNAVESLKSGESTQANTKTLLVSATKVNHAKFELIAYKKDSLNKYLVLGSVIESKAVSIQNNTYLIDIQSLYGKQKEDGMEVKGDLGIYYTHVPASAIEKFLADYQGIKASYAAAKPNKDVISFSYAVSNDVLFTFDKISPNQSIDDCTVWVGKSKHVVNTIDLIKALNDFIKY